MDKDDDAIDCFENANQSFEKAENYYELAEIHRVKKERLKEAVKNYELSFNLEQDYLCLLASSRGLSFFKNRDAELDKWIEEKATEMTEKCDKILEKEDLTLSNFSASQIWSALSYCDYVLGNKEKRIHSATVAATRNEDDLDLWQEKADAEFAGLISEREQKITIDVAYRYFQSFTVILFQ